MYVINIYMYITAKARSLAVHELAKYPGQFPIKNIFLALAGQLLKWQEITGEYSKR